MQSAWWSSLHSHLHLNKVCKVSSTFWLQMCQLTHLTFQFFIIIVTTIWQSCYHYLVKFQSGFIRNILHFSDKFRSSSLYPLDCCTLSTDSTSLYGYHAGTPYSSWGWTKAFNSRTSIVNQDITTLMLYIFCRRMYMIWESQFIVYQYSFLQRWALFIETLCLCSRFT